MFSIRRKNSKYPKYTKMTWYNNIYSQQDLMYNFNVSLSIDHKIAFFPLSFSLFFSLCVRSIRGKRHWRPHYRSTRNLAAISFFLPKEEAASRLI